MTFADYRSAPGVNWSSLKQMAVSPLNYRYRRDNPTPDKPAWALGRLVHALVLEPETVPDQYAVWEGKVRRGKAWDTFQLEHAGREFVTAADWKTAHLAAGAVERHDGAQSLLVDGAPEVSLSWTDAETGIQCKGRADYLSSWAPPRRIVDLKTTSAATPQQFGSQAVNYGYFGQLAFYHDGAGCSAPPMIIAVQTVPPYDVWPLDCAAVLRQGRRYYRDLLALLVQCEAEDHWPGAVPGVGDVLVPGWYAGDDDPSGLGLEGI